MRSIIHNFYLIYLVYSLNIASVGLTPSQSYYEVGSSVILTCSIPISHYIDTDVIINIQWSNNITESISIESNIKEFYHSITFNQLKLSDAGEYNCTYYLISANDNPYIKPSEVKTEVTNVTIKSKLRFRVIRHHSFVVPKGKNPFIVSSFKTYENGSFIKLTCYATYLNTSLIDVATNVNIQWLNSSNHTLHSYTGLNDYTEHTLNYTISNVNLTNAGQYTCAFFIDSANHPYILASDTIISSVNISISKYFVVYRGSFYYTH